METRGRGRSLRGRRPQASGPIGPPQQHQPLHQQAPGTIGSPQQQPQPQSPHMPASGSIRPPQHASSPIGPPLLSPRQQGPRGAWGPQALRQRQGAAQRQQLHEQDDGGRGGAPQFDPGPGGLWGLRMQQQHQGGGGQGSRLQVKVPAAPGPPVAHQELPLSIGRASFRPGTVGRPAQQASPILGRGTAAAAISALGDNRRDEEEAAGRGGVRGRRVIREHVFVRTRPDDMQSKQGTTGRNVTLITNFFRLVHHTNWTLNQYRVDFTPEIDLTKDKKRYVHTALREILAGYIFDGTVLYTPRRLESNPMERVVDHLNNPEDKVTIVFRCVGDVGEGDPHLIQVNNLIMRRCLGMLDLQLMGRNFYDPRGKKVVPEYKLEIWPGYDSSIRQHETEILMNVDICHKISNIETVLDILDKCRQRSRDFRQAFVREVIGCVVLTVYNNRTMKVDDIDWDKNPLTTFPRSDGTEISFVDYYKTQYGQTIRNHHQPLLVSRATARELRGGMSEIKLLVPELCRMTGLTDAQRNNMQLMRAVAEHTRLFPSGRVQQLNGFMQRLRATPEIVTELRNWDFQLDEELVKIKARVLPPESIFASTELQCKNVDWTQSLFRQPMYTLALCDVFTIVYPRQIFMHNKQMDARGICEGFVQMLLRAASGMSWRLPQPQFHEMPDDRPTTYVNHLETVCSQNKPSIIMCVVSNNKSDRYSAIKKKLCLDRAVPSQVIVARNMNAKGAMSIASKVVIQMNCKLGGAPWIVRNPLKSVMTIGYDACHEPGNKSRSHGAFVATMNQYMTGHYSTSESHTSGEEISRNFGMHVLTCVKAYADCTGKHPDTIFIYRDGVGEGDEQYVMAIEVDNIKQCLESYYPNNTLKLAFIIVTKRIRTRFFGVDEKSNPEPGTVVDDVVTRPERFDFYIVSQCVRQGTVSPTSYNVIYNTTGLSPDLLQRFTYKLTHVYYNWSGTVRVPAPCQYAHRLAFFVAQTLRREPNRNLRNLLYFL